MQRLLTEWFAPTQVAKRPRFELDGLLLVPPLVPCVRREGKFIVRRIPAATIELTKSMLDGVNGDAQTMRRLHEQFGEFSVLNGLPMGTPNERAIVLWLFICDMVVQELKASSCRTYMALVLEGHARAGTPIVSPLVGDLGKALALLHAEEETEHAPDLPPEVLWAIMEASPETLKLALWLVLALGCRCADVEHLKCGDVALEPDGTVVISFAITKNHRSKASSYSVRLKPKLIPELGQILRAKADKPLPHLSSDQVNRGILSVLAAHPHLLAPSDPQGTALPIPTSYSFRRCFMQFIIGKFTDDEGMVNWVSAIRCTGHINLNTLRVSYTKKFSNTL